MVHGTAAGTSALSYGFRTLQLFSECTHNPSTHPRQKGKLKESQLTKATQIYGDMSRTWQKSHLGLVQNLVILFGDVRKEGSELEGVRGQDKELRCKCGDSSVPRSNPHLLGLQPLQIPEK